MGRHAQKETLCWECLRAGGDCSWSRHGEPVEDWLAIETAVKNRTYASLVSYEVLDCPLFIKETKHRYTRIDPDGAKALAAAVLWRAIKDRGAQIVKTKRPGDHQRLWASIHKLERVFHEDSLWMQLSEYGPELLEEIRKGDNP